MNKQQYLDFLHSMVNSIVEATYVENPVANIKFKRLNSMATTPSRGSEQAAGYDLYAAIDTPYKIMPHCTVKVGTGLAFELPDETFGAIFARSGLATKKGLRPANCVGR